MIANQMTCRMRNADDGVQQVVRCSHAAHKIETLCPNSSHRDKTSSEIFSFVILLLLYISTTELRP